jgi:acyl-[acyl-carrier-protein]-phospholipid O-acyltransferase/long-chain-fatty-acid--[acyl-carrier-protein] ligase
VALASDWHPILPRAFLRMCRRNKHRPKVADTTGVDMTGGDLLLRALICRRLLLGKVLQPDERFVGLLLPPTAAGVLANIALPLAGRIPVNLNYTVSSDVLNSCIRQCNIRHVLTSRKVLERFHFELDAELVFLEDFREQVTLVDKLVGAFQAKLLPIWLLERWLGLDKLQDNDLLTVIFTSGSTGEPKGVMLSQRNVASNIECIQDLLDIRPHDVVAGILPFFHSTGFTTILWSVLTLDPKGVYHTSPLEAAQIGKMCREHKVTVLVSAPTFLRAFVKRTPAEDFASLEIVLTGAEKLPMELADAFEKKFGVRPLEGYGTTELSPLSAVNVPPNRMTKPDQISKLGTVGRPIPDVQVKAVDPETFQDLGRNKPGLLWFKGPNVMLGYLNHPELTAEAIHDGWYNTGDIGLVDDDGCVQITGRESRFSKIGGEMVPHIRIEEEIQAIISADADELKAAVTAVPDARKGERIVVLHTRLEMPPEQICQRLAAEGLPNIWIPTPDSFKEVDQIPVLGTGKLDLRGLKDLALARFGNAPVRAATTATRDS